MRTVCILQARMRSSRLPGKVLLPLAGRSVLAHVIERCRAFPGVTEVCCATTTSEDDEAVVDEAHRCGAATFRGSETDVLKRYCEAARAMGADVVLRVTADCPLLDPAVAGQVLDLYAREVPTLATNNIPPSWPHGLDVEVFGRDWLERADREARDLFDREHVSPYIRRHPEARIVNLPSPEPNPLHRWTIDTPADYDFLARVFDAVPGPRPGLDHRALLKILAADPQLYSASIDPGRKQGFADTRLGAQGLTA